MKFLPLHLSRQFALSLTFLHCYTHPWLFIIWNPLCWSWAPQFSAPSIWATSLLVTATVRFGWFQISYSSIDVKNLNAQVTVVPIQSCQSPWKCYYWQRLGLPTRYHLWCLNATALHSSARLTQLCCRYLFLCVCPLLDKPHTMAKELHLFWFVVRVFLLLGWLGWLNSMWFGCVKPL